MTIIRIEARQDPASHLYYLEVYHPADAQQPFVTTQPRYKTQAAAENDLIAIVAAAANSPRQDRSG
jgi:hypothetical protein